MTGARIRVLSWAALLVGSALASTGLDRPAASPGRPDFGTVPAVQVVRAAAAGSALTSIRAGTAPSRPTQSRRAAVPTRLRVPSLGIDARVVGVTVRPGGELAVPDDPRMVGWWRAGAAPGSARGTVVIDGHVDTQADGPGALFRLADLRPGERVVLGTTGGLFSYVVRAVRTYRKALLPGEVFDRSGAPRLVLISCGGEFDRRTRNYADNIVAYTVPISS